MIRLFIFGLLIGVSDLVPGISGGMMAVILGIYNKLVSTIGFFFKDIKNFKQNILFLVPLFTGIALSILIFSGLFHYLLTYHRVATFSTFIGLILGSLPHLFNTSFPHKKEFTRHPILWVCVLMGMLIPIGMMILHNHINTNYQMVDFLHVSLTQGVILFCVGMIAAIAMLFPGVSGSLLLIILGFYDPIISMIAFNNIFTYILPLIIFVLGVGAGIFTGSLVFAKLLKAFFKPTISVILGVILGAFIYITNVQIIPYITFSAMSLTLHLGLVIVGFFISYNLEKLNHFSNK